MRIKTQLPEHLNPTLMQVPAEARLGGSSSAESALAWNEFAAADAADWDNFDDEGEAVKGYVCCLRNRAGLSSASKAV